jgi:uncharacterized membrane-anchored protein
MLTILLPVVIVLTLTIKPLITLTKGEEIKLQTVPLDPRDLFYGDYVNLDFEAESVPASLLEPKLRKELSKDTNKYQTSDTKVYLTLEYSKETNTHKVTALGVNKPKSGTFIKAKLYPFINDNKVTVEIPIDKYYLEEYTGTKLEDASKKGQLVATIKVLDGYAILQSVE